MKIKGREFTTPNIEVLVLPRSDEDIVIKAQGVYSFDDFYAICPVPKVPEVIGKGGKKEYKENDETYGIQLQKHAEYRMDWMILKSLEATEELEWETVDMTNPKTWKNFRKELREAYFTDLEIKRIENLAATANSLNETVLELARRNFLLDQVKESEKSTGPSTGPATT